MALQQVKWGTITLDLDNGTFRKAFISGRNSFVERTSIVFIGMGQLPIPLS